MLLDFILYVAQQIATDPHPIHLSIQDVLALGAVVIVAGGLWRQIITNSKSVKKLEIEMNKNRELAELRAQRIEDHQTLIIDKISNKLEDMGDRFLEFGHELREILANHNTRLALLEQRNMKFDDEQDQSS